jgi:Kef-type K+ transport system membrane component KefB
MDLPRFLFSLIVIYISARLLGELLARAGQSAVLGELLAGILLGDSGLAWLKSTETLRLMGEIGVMLLLFEVGLESDLKAFLQVGWSAALVAVIGVVMPFLLGYALAVLLHMSQLQAIFIGATLTATSVAIAARALSDLDKLHSREGYIILGAAVLDDILGLVTLSVLLGLATSGVVSWGAIARTASVAFLVLVLGVLIGIRYAHLFSRLVNRMRTRGRLIVASVTFALLVGYLADCLNVAPLVGAFAAGLVLARTEHHAHIGQTVQPVTDLFVPIFFVLIGAAVDLHQFNPFNPHTRSILLLTGGLLAAAVVGKLMAGLGAFGKGVNRRVVGVGMLARGEVGLIFASVGLSHEVLNTAYYSAVVAVVVVTTVMAPPLLKWMLRTPARG